MANKYNALEPEQKALEINLDLTIYGSFAEIGAGQEVARYFFQAGGAAGTIAKSMSAYDKTVSDKIYGQEDKGRYVCEKRLYKMLDHEYDLVVERLTEERPNTRFFSFADTVSAINFHKTNVGHGWMGLRFQLEAGGKPNDLVLHAKLLDNDNKLQQQAIGILGVNVLYACYRYHNDIDQLIVSLTDNLRGRIEVDMLRLSGPEFMKLDQRLLCLKLVNNKMTDVAIFDSNGTPQHASEILHRKSLLVVRGSYHPPTLVNMDMLRSGEKQFSGDLQSASNSVVIMAEITLNNLKLMGDIDERDFLDRAEILCHLGQSVIVSNCEQQNKLIHYFENFRLNKLGIVIGVMQLEDLMYSKFHEHKDGSLLAAFGELFNRGVKLYVYPALHENGAGLMNCHNMPVPDGIRFLYQHLLDHHFIEDLTEYHSEILHIYSRHVLDLLRADKNGWEEMVPESVAEVIKDKKLFGFPSTKLEFEY